MSNNTERSKTPETGESKQPWEPITLTYVGHIGEIVQIGGGKTNLTGGDTGEPRKETPH